MRQLCLAKPPPTLWHFSFHCHFTNSLSNSTMPSKPKTSRREHSIETVSVILALHNLGKSLGQVSDHVKVPRATVGHIIHRATRTPDHLLRLNKRAGRLAKLDGRARRALIRHVERNPHDNLASLGTPSTSGTKLGRKVVRGYLKVAGFLRFKPRRKRFLTQKRKEAKLR